MLHIVLSAIGLLILAAGVFGAWMVRRVLRNEGPHSATFLAGAGLAVLAHGLLSVALIFNRASWFGTGLAIAAALYLSGLALQRIGRRRS